MTQQADDKELMAAFAEFKQLLQRESEPVGASKAPAVSLAPEANAAALDGAALEAPRLFAADAPIARPLANHFAPPPVAPALGGAEGWSVASSGEGEAPVAESEPSGGRRKLVYVSLAVIAIGVASLGWTLTKWRPMEDPVADLNLPAEPEALAPGASEAALEPPAAEPAKDAAPTAEAPTTDKAELTPPRAVEAPAHGQPQPAAAAPEAAASLPEPAAPPPPAPAPRRVEAVSAPPTASEAVAPVAAAAAGAALASTGAAAGRLTPPSAPRTAALPPANRFTPPEPAAPMAHPAPKPPAPAKIAKPKPAPTPTAAKHAKPHTAPAERAPVASAAPVAAAPEPTAPPPASPQSEGGPFGFMKRTLNSVGSTISGVTRSVIP